MNLQKFQWKLINYAARRSYRRGPVSVFVWICCRFSDLAQLALLLSVGNCREVQSPEVGRSVLVVHCSCLFAHSFPPLWWSSCLEGAGCTKLAHRWLSILQPFLAAVAEGVAGFGLGQKRSLRVWWRVWGSCDSSELHVDKKCRNMVAVWVVSRQVATSSAGFCSKILAILH